MINGYFYIYNCEGLISYDEKLISDLPEIDFYKIFKTYFVELEERGNHKYIVKENYKIYLWWNGKLVSSIEVQYAGLKAVEELIILAKLQKWSIMSPYKRELVNLEFIDAEGFKNIDDFLIKKYYSE